MAIDVGSAVGYLELDTTGFTKGISGAMQQLVSAATSTDSLSNKFKAIGSTTTTVGTTLTKNVTAPLALLGAGAVSASAKFEAGMSEVKAISRATAGEMQSLKEKAIEMGAKTKFSASESADAFKFMAQAGWTASDMISGINGVMALAAASGEDLALTSSIVTDSLTAFGLSAKDSTMFADVLAMAANATNTSVAEMGEAFKYIAPVAGAMNYSVQDVSVALGEMANSGIKASTAGTSLRSLLTNLAKPTEKMEAAMSKYKISLTDASGEMLPLNELLLGMREKFSGLSEVQKTNLAATLAGKEGMSGLLAIVNASDESWSSLTNNINDAGGSADEAAAIMQDNLQGSLEQLGGGIESFAISIGDVLSPKIRQIAIYVSELVDNLNSMSTAQKEQIVKIAGIVAAVGPAFIILGKIVTVVSSVAGAFSTMSATIGGAITAAGGLSPAIAALGATLGPILLVIAGVVAAVIALKVAWETNFNGIREKTAKIVEDIKSIVDSTVTIVKNIVKKFIQAFNDDFMGMKTFFVGIWNGIKIVFATVMDAIVDIFDIFAALFKGDWKGVWEGIKKLCSDIWDGIVALLKSAMDTMVTVTKKILAVLIENFKSNLDKILQFFKDLPGNIAYLLGFVIGKIVKWTIDMIATVKEELPKLIENIGAFFKELPSNIGKFLAKVVVSIINWCKDLTKTSKEELPKVTSNILQFFKDLPSKMGEIGGNIVSGLWNGISNMGEWVKEKITGWCGNFVDGFKEALGIHSPSVVFMKLGEFIDEGLAKGILKKKNVTADAMQQIATLLEKTGDAISTGLIVFDEKTNKLIYSSTYKAVMKKINLYYKDRDARISAMKKGTQSNIEAIQSELEATQAAYNVKIKLYEQELKAKQALVDTQSNSQVKALQDQIDAIDAQRELESRQEAAANYEKELADKKQKMIDDAATYQLELTKKLAEISNSSEEDKLSAIEEAAELTKSYEASKASALEEIDNLQSDRRKELLEQQRSDEQEALRARIEEIRDAAEEQKDILQDEYDAKVYALDQQYQAEVEYLNRVKVILQKDYEERQEREQLHTQIKKKEHELQTGNLSKEQKKQTENEIAELKAREAELTKSIEANKTTLSDAVEDVKSIGDQYGDALLQGFKSTDAQLKSYLDGIVSYAMTAISQVKAAASTISTSTSSVLGTLIGIGTNAVKSSSISVKGSYANGLDFVPYNGFVAELHEGEKVLTKEEAKTTSDGGDTYNFYSPKALTPAETARQLKRAKKEMALGFN